MKEVDKKDAPEISGGYIDPDSPIPATGDPDYPRGPITGTGEEDLPVGTTLPTY